MTREEVIEKINDFLIDEFEVEQDQLDPNRNMQEVLELDSLDYVDLVVVIESNFGFKLTAEDFKGVATFHDFYNIIYAKISAS